MYAAVSTRASLGQQIKLALVAGILVLSLVVGIANAAQRVGATAPQQVGQVATGGVTIDDGNNTAEKPNNGTNKGKQKHTVCIQFSALEWELMYGEKTDAGGMVCHKE